MTQSSPPYCGLTTLAMMLNSLNIDPNQRWQGGWRWFNEDMLLGNCCKPRSEVEQDGMTRTSSRDARCHGAVVECTRASEGGVDAFREQPRGVSSPSPPLLAASSRARRSARRATGTSRRSPATTPLPTTCSCPTRRASSTRLGTRRCPSSRGHAPARDPASGRARGYMHVAPSSHLVISTRRSATCPQTAAAATAAPWRPYVGVLPCAARRGSSPQYAETQRPLRRVDSLVKRLPVGPLREIQ